MTWKYKFCVLHTSFTLPDLSSYKRQIGTPISISLLNTNKHHTKITTQQNVQAKPGEVRLWLHGQWRQRSGLDQRWLLRNQIKHVTKYQGQPQQQSGIISSKQHFQQYMGSVKIKFKELMPWCSCLPNCAGCGTRFRLICWRRTESRDSQPYTAFCFH